MPTRPAGHTETARSVRALIRAYAPVLGPSEGAVARVILERPDEVPGWSTQQLAQVAGASPATVVRACQRLGFRGFQHLRLELAREGAPAEVAPGDGVEQLFESAREALARGSEAVDREALSRAAALLARARRIVFAGNGFSAPPLQDAAMRFATLGHAVEAPLDILAQQFLANTLGPADVCLALTHSGANTHTLSTCKAAKRRGAQLVVVSSFLRAPIPELADVVISTGAIGPQHAVDPFFVRLNHQVLLQALLAEIEQTAAASEHVDPSDMRAVVAEALADAAD